MPATWVSPIFSPSTCRLNLGVVDGIQAMSNSSHFDRKYQLVDEVSGEVISNHPYRITKPDGSVIKGISNTQGETELSESAVMAGMKMVLLPKRRGE